MIAPRDTGVVANGEAYFDFACGFCGQSTEDDPRRLRLDLTFAHSEALQAFGAHWSCLKAVLDRRASNTLYDPLE